MPTLTDKRPFFRGKRLGFQTLNTIFDNLFALVTIIGAEHDSSSGSHKTRKVTNLRGNYTWDAVNGWYALAGGTSGLDIKLVPSATGTVAITFATVPETTFDVHLTPGLDVDGRPGQIGYTVTTRTTGSVTIKMTKCASTTAENLTGFTVSISYTPV